MVRAAKVVDSDTGVDLRALLGDALGRPALKSSKAPAAAPQLAGPAETLAPSPPALAPAAPAAPEPAVPPAAAPPAASPALEQAIKDTSVLEAVPAPGGAQASIPGPQGPGPDDARALLGTASGGAPADSRFGGALLEAPSSAALPTPQGPDITAVPVPGGSGARGPLETLRGLGIDAAPEPSNAGAPGPLQGAQNTLAGAQDAASAAASAASDSAPPAPGTVLQGGSIRRVASGGRAARTS